MAIDIDNRIRRIHREQKNKHMEKQELKQFATNRSSIDAILEQLFARFLLR